MSGSYPPCCFALCLVVVALATSAQTADAQEPGPEVTAPEPEPEPEQEPEQEPGQEPEPEPEPGAEQEQVPAPAVDTSVGSRTASITLSLSALKYAFGELAWEQRLGHDLSSVAILGVGHGPFSDDETERRTMFEVGGQLRYTFAGDFEDGMGAALDARFLRVGADDEGNYNMGVAVGPRLFWKWIVFSGVTLDIHLGASWVWATLGNPEVTHTVKRDGLQSTGSVNLGWSFGG